MTPELIALANAITNAELAGFTHFAAALRELVATPNPPLHETHPNR